ncbi:MAG: hypothetical protein ACREQ3_08205 [Candidatus Binatia bacterium]
MTTTPHQQTRVRRFPRQKALAITSLMLGLFDLKDQIPNCGTNTWKRNSFGTASQPCIQ